MPPRFPSFGYATIISRYSAFYVRADTRMYMHAYPSVYIRIIPIRERDLSRAVAMRRSIGLHRVLLARASIDLSREIRFNDATQSLSTIYVVIRISHQTDSARHGAEKRTGETRADPRALFPRDLCHADPRRLGIHYIRRLIPRPSRLPFSLWNLQLTWN